MTIDPTASTSASEQTSPVKGAEALGRDAFLSLLVTQLQHQNPLEPQADGEFLAQLAQFSSLEQLQEIKRDMATLVEVMTTALTELPASEGGA